MKRTVIAVSLIALLFAVAARSQAPVPKPAPELKKLEVWIGEWILEGKRKATPLGPADKYSGKASGRWILGGFFEEFRIEVNGALAYYEIDGYDPVNKKFTWNAFDSDGRVWVGTYTLEANTQVYSATITSGDKKYKLRGTVVLAADLNSFVEKNELSVDGKTWMPKDENKFIKAKSSPK